MLRKFASKKVYRFSPRLTEDLGAAFEVLQDYLTESLCYLFEQRDIRNIWLYNQLPYFARLRCDAGLCKDFLTTLATLAFKTFGPLPFPLACRAEELLLAWAADEVETMRGARGKTFSGKEDFLGTIIGDLDFQLMYDPAFEGIDEVPLVHTGSFRMEDWFRPYSFSDAIPNPLTWPVKTRYRYKNLRRFRL